jgi:site-specific DNA-cytosine methylase
MIEDRDILHFHLFCGLGGGAHGFNNGRAELNGLRGRFRCVGGVDVSPAAIRDFNRVAGVPGTVLDMFDREQYWAFHGAEPPAGWREATPQDIQRAAGNRRPHIVFLSAPCKGFSGLLSQTRSLTDKYQALNRLTLRGVWLTLEAWADDPPDLILFENVPRIATRGRALLDRIGTLLRHYGYAVAETFHDCGEIGGLAQSRKRFLLVARHVAKVPAFLYEPPKRPLRAVGEILERLPLPGDLRGGPMHSIPNLQWKTWVRLAFVEAGSDWRSLNKLRVVDGKLADYLLMREQRNDFLGVNAWDQPTGAVTGDARPGKGAFSVADPRHPHNNYQALSVEDWQKSTSTITGQRAGNNLFIADPRAYGSETHKNVYRIVRWDETSPTVTSGHGPSSGGMSVADPRHFGPEKSWNAMRITPFDKPLGAVTGAHGDAQCVADPRFLNSQGQYSGKYSVQPWDEPSSTITGSDRIGSGALCVADPRPDWDRRGNNLIVEDWNQPSHTIIGGGKGVQGGWLSVADPRPAAQRGKGDAYLTNGNYGVVPWDQPSGAVSAAANHDNGRWNVADPRLPEASEKLIAIIRAIDGTWHRPFTTLELAALQSLVDPDNLFDLDGSSDSAKRERIGNAAPPLAAQAIADLMGQTLLMAWSGQSFALSATPIWVQPIAVALSVKTPEVPA